MAGADMTPTSPEQLRAALAASQQRVADMAAAQEDFLRVVSHDLRAPLRHITSYGKLVREVLGDLPADVLQSPRRCKKRKSSSAPWSNRPAAWRRCWTAAGPVARGPCTVAPAAGGLGCGGSKSPGRAAHGRGRAMGVARQTCHPAG